MSQAAASGVECSRTNETSAARPVGVMPWPVLAVLAVFTLGIETALIYLSLHSLNERNVGEMIAFFSGIGALIWPFVALGVLLKVALGTRRQ